MSTILGDALKEALKAKKSDYSSFIWKGKKVKEGDKFIQTSVRLVDMDAEELKKCYKHCEKMLYSTNLKHLGRYHVLKEINEQIYKCHIELLLRYFENSYLKNELRTPTKRTPGLAIVLRQYMANHPEVEDWSTHSVSEISSNIPEEFNDINIADLLEGCVDYLGAFEKKHITLAFIVRMGVWLTKSEDKELSKVAKSKEEKLAYISKKIKLPQPFKLKYSSKGLSYKELKSIINLQKEHRYSDMTTDQLLILRNKVLHRLSLEVDTHIHNWKYLQRQIELVARSKGIDLNELV